MVHCKKKGSKSHRNADIVNNVAEHAGEGQYSFGRRAGRFANDREPIPALARALAIFGTPSLQNFMRCGGERLNFKMHLRSRSRETQGLLPNFIIGGAPKSGTSSLHLWLADHPQALGSSDKETYFFVDPGTHMYRQDVHVAEGLNDYRRFFPYCDGNGEAPRVVFESTPSYLYSQTALAHIPDLETEPKVLFILRQPEKQVYSLYKYFRSNWNWIPEGMSFKAYIDLARSESASFKGNELARYAIRNARYVEHLTPWLERLGPDRIRVALFEDMARNPRAFIQDIAAWLGLDAAFYDTYTFARENETYAVKSTWLQHVNIALRSRLPRGLFYDALRRAYRGLNTRRPPGPSAADETVVRALADEFAAANRDLARTFDIDLTAWSTPAVDRSAA